MYVHACSCKTLPQQHVCSAVSTDYASSTLWFDTDDLDDELSQINELPGSDECNKFLSLLNCTIRYPACNANQSKVLPICPSQCPQIELQKAQCVVLLNDYPDFQMVKGLLNSFECNQPETYYNFDESYIDSSDCIMLSKSYILSQ